jgi:hypothetical protein
MNSKPIFPESVRIGSNYSFRADMKLNAWAFVAVVMAFGARIALHRHVEWGVPLRAVVSLFPLLASLLYVRSIAGWIRGMDELQRRIQLEACLFATTGTIFVATAFNLLAMAGVLQASRIQNGLGWEGMFATVIACFVLGNLIINRRYR